MEKPWKVIAAFIGVFVAGAVFGGFFSLRSWRRPVPQPVVQLPPPQNAKVQVAGPQLVPQAPVAKSATPITPQIMRDFTRSLKLTPPQREKVQPIVARAGEDFQRIRDEEARRKQEYLADVARVNERMYVDVAAMLTPEQREKLQAKRQDIEDKMAAKRAEALAEAANRAKQKESERAAAKQGGETPK